MKKIVLVLLVIAMATAVFTFSGRSSSGGNDNIDIEKVYYCARSQDDCMVYVVYTVYGKEDEDITV